MSSLSRYRDVMNSEIPDSEKISKIIYIDSRNRDINLYKDTNDYTIPLSEVLYGVTEVSLVSAEIPKTHYLIDESNNFKDDA